MFVKCSYVVPCRLCCAVGFLLWHDGCEVQHGLCCATRLVLCHDGCEVQLCCATRLAMCSKGCEVQRRLCCATRLVLCHDGCEVQLCCRLSVNCSLLCYASMITMMNILTFALHIVLRLQGHLIVKEELRSSQCGVDGPN